MFSSTTANFINQVDPGGSLINMTRLTESDRVFPMALVIKAYKNYWQSQKYHLVGLSLNDLLQGDTGLSPGVSESKFATYEEDESKKLEANVGLPGLSVGAGYSSSLQSSLGKLKKKELDLSTLMKDSKDRQVNMRHQQVRRVQKDQGVLAVVKERIFTTDSCTIIQDKQKSLGIQGMLGSLLPNLFTQDSNQVEADSKASLTIPPGTALAYSILELEIDGEGHFNICPRPGGGGFVSSFDMCGMVCNSQSASFDGLRCGLLELELDCLAELPHPTQRQLLDLLKETVRDAEALSCLQCVLDDRCSGEPPDMSKCEELSDSLRSSMVAMLDRLAESRGDEKPAPLKATHLLVSAMEELPEETLYILSAIPDEFVEALNTMMQKLKGRDMFVGCLPVLLQDHGAFEVATLLLKSVKVTLQKEADTVWTGRDDGAGYLPDLLRLSTRGLALLCKP